MWSLVARASPHAGTNPLTIIYLVAHQRFRPPIPKACPPALASLMERCWAQEQAERCVGVLEFVHGSGQHAWGLLAQVIA